MGRFIERLRGVTSEELSTREHRAEHVDPTTVRYGNRGARKAAGVIVYECKARLKWSNEFLKQTMAAGQQHKTPYLILVTSAMPGREKEQVCVRDSVVIVQPHVALTHLGKPRPHDCSRTSPGRTFAR